MNWDIDYTLNNHIQKLLPDRGEEKSGTIRENSEILSKNENKRAAWVVQSVKCLSLGFGLGSDLGVVRSIPVLGSVLSVVCLRFSLPLRLMLMFSVSVSISKTNELKKKKKEP